MINGVKGSKPGDGSMGDFCGLLITSASEPPIMTAAGTGQAGASGDGGPAAAARLNQPFDLAFDRQGNLFFSDTFNHRVRRIDHASGTITTVAGTGKAGYSGDGGPAAEAQLNEPYGVVVDRNGNLFVADRLNRRVQAHRWPDAHDHHDRRQRYQGLFRRRRPRGPRPAWSSPTGSRSPATDESLFIADVAGNRIRRLDLANGTDHTFAGTGRGRHEGDGGPADRASIWGARAVDVGPDGSVYILEREGNSLRVVSADSGKIATIAGTGRKGYSGDGGPAVTATFNGPKELAVDANGNIWIVDTENHAIRLIDAATRLIRTVAGTGSTRRRRRWRAGNEGASGPTARRGYRS